jgi:DNA-directed RNA polymerase I subunit RPA12
MLFCRLCGNLLDLPTSTADCVICDICKEPHQCSEMEGVETITKSRAGVFSSEQQNDDCFTSTTGAIIDEICPKCGNPQMRYFTMQLRSADEGQTVFYTCIKEGCNYTYSLNS